MADPDEKQKPSDAEVIAELIEGMVASPVPFTDPEYRSCEHDWSGHVCGLCEPGYHMVCSKCHAQVCVGLFEEREDAEAAVGVVVERIAKSIEEDDTVDPGVRYHA